MARLKTPKPCEFKDCKEKLGKGSAVIGFDIDGVTHEIKACPFHTGIIQIAQPGTWHITADRELKARPAQFFVKKGFK